MPDKRFPAHLGHENFISLVGSLSRTGPPERRSRLGLGGKHASGKLGIYISIYRINSLPYSHGGSSAKKSSSSFLLLNPLIFWRYNAAVLWFSISSLLCLLMFKNVFSWSIPKNRLLARLTAMPVVLLPENVYIFKRYLLVKQKVSSIK